MKIFYGRKISFLLASLFIKFCKMSIKVISLDSLFHFLQIISLLVSKCTTGLTSFIVIIIAIELCWILQKFQFGLFPSFYCVRTIVIKPWFLFLSFTIALLSPAVTLILSLIFYHVSLISPHSYMFIYRLSFLFTFTLA